MHNVAKMFGFTRISLEDDPNEMEYEVRNSFHTRGRCKSNIYTDGKLIAVDTSTGRTDQWKQDVPGTSCFERDTTYVACGATWVVIEKDNREHNTPDWGYSLVLYTSEQDEDSLLEFLMSNKDMRVQRKEQLLRELTHRPIRDEADISSVMEIAEGIMEVKAKVPIWRIRLDLEKAESMSISLSAGWPKWPHGEREVQFTLKYSKGGQNYSFYPPILEGYIAP